MNLLTPEGQLDQDYDGYAGPDGVQDRRLHVLLGKCFDDNAHRSGKVEQLVRQAVGRYDVQTKEQIGQEYGQDAVPTDVVFSFVFHGS